MTCLSANHVAIQLTGRLEKLQFALPAVFTIGPDNKLDALKKYALLLSGNPDGSVQRGTVNARDHVQSIVKGIIEVIVPRLSSLFCLYASTHFAETDFYR